MTSLSQQTVRLQLYSDVLKRALYAGKKARGDVNGDATIALWVEII